MTIKPPSYLILRNGIYYLQIRTPKRFADKRQSKSLLMRRSTRTGNLREALLIARKWTVELMAKADDMNLFMHETAESLSQARKYFKLILLRLENLQGQINAYLLINFSWNALD